MEGSTVTYRLTLIRAKSAGDALNSRPAVLRSEWAFFPNRMWSQMGYRLSINLNPGVYASSAGLLALPDQFVESTQPARRVLVTSLGLDGRAFHFFWVS